MYSSGSNTVLTEGTITPRRIDLNPNLISLDAPVPVVTIASALLLGLLFQGVRWPRRSGEVPLQRTGRRRSQGVRSEQPWLQIETQSHVQRRPGANPPEGIGGWNLPAS